MLDPNIFYILRIVLFFVSTFFIFRALQAVDLSRLFRANSTDQIRLIFVVISFILGYLFTDALVSLFENLNNLF
ncbi:MAG: DUF1146 family protein [Firmicutes bacterium]|nr:DUF1146 family protein [Bacillota bacterium]